MVGTAVYQVGFTSSSQAKKRRALKPGVQLTDAPEASDERTAAIRPWMWNNGMMLRQRSFGFSATAPPIWRAEAARLAADSGTILGRAVVPEVCSTNALSIPRDGPVLLALAGESARVSSVNRPAGPAATGISSMIGTPTFCATARTGESMPCWTITALGLRSSR